MTATHAAEDNVAEVEVEHAAIGAHVGDLLDHVADPQARAEYTDALRRWRALDRVIHQLWCDRHALFLARLLTESAAA